MITKLDTAWDNAVCHHRYDILGFGGGGVWGFVMFWVLCICSSVAFVFFCLFLSACE